MAITPNKKGVVTGTKKKDKITWAKKSIWQKNLTVNALAGNDTITFTNSTYKNKLNGGDGKDIIKGGKKNDTITGGTGNDTIYTGKGTNTLVINKGDGNDTIYTQGTKNTLKFNKPNSKDKANVFEKKGNDLILTYTHTKAKKDKKNVTEKLTLKNYYKNDGTIANNNIYIQDKKNQKVSSLVKDLKITGVNNEFRGTYKADIINGTGKADKIYGNGGNDTISAGNGNDIIYGNNGDDFIIGGKGADIINAGAGRNTIVHSAGDGDDVIVSGGGNDKLSFGGVNSIDDITATFTDNNVVFELPNEEKITLQNALTKAHSVDTIEIGDDKYTTDRFKNSIISHDAITYGTAWHDDIQVYNLPPGTNYPEIYAGAGNDIIYVSPFSRMPRIYVGAGDDTVSLVYDGSYKTINCKIFFENGDGNNTLTGLSNNLSTLSQIDIFSDDLYHGIRLSDSFSYNYVTGTRDGNNLVLALTGGETFTMENYYGISLDLKEKIRIKEKGESSSLYKLLNYLKFEDDFIYIDDEKYENPDHEHFYDVNKSDSTLIAHKTNYSRLFFISGYGGNDIVVQAQDDDISLQSGNNKIYAGGGSFSLQIDYENLTGNEIYYDGTNCWISTSIGGSTYANVSCTSSSIIYLYGEDDLYLKKGKYSIGIDYNYDEYITLNTDTNKVEIDGIEDAKSTTIRQILDERPTDIMFEHYANWKDSHNNDHLSVIYMDENGSIINGENNKELIFKGKWTGDEFNLDDKAVGDKVTVTADQNFYMTKTLSQMTQYADMTNSSLNKEIDFFDKAQNGLLDNSAGVYLKGSDSQDYYSGYTFANGKVTINDAGGSGTNGDILRLDMARNQYRFFIDIDTEGNTASNDMFIFKFTNEPYSQEFAQYDGLLQYLYGNEDNIDAYIKIENSIEATKSSGVPGTWYLLDGQIEYINDNETTGGINLQQYFYSINMDVAGWLNAYNDNYSTECNSISEAIADGQAQSSELVSLYRLYSDDTNWGGY